MKDNGLVVSVEYARDLLGSEAEGMSDSEIIELIKTLGLLAENSLQTAIDKRRERDAHDFAQLLYDIYQEKRDRIE